MSSTNQWTWLVSLYMMTAVMIAIPTPRFPLTHEPTTVLYSKKR